MRDARASGRRPPLHQVHNFDALVGVLLSDVPAPMAGELCCYPGSHLALASHLAAPGAMDALRANGNTVLPTDRTDTLFERPAAHCTGKAGDVFLANYMTAHFIAPVSLSLRMDGWLIRPLSLSRCAHTTLSGRLAHRIRRHISGTPCISGCRAHTTTRLGGPRRCSTRG